MFRDPYSGQAIPAMANLVDDELVEHSDPAFDADALRAWLEVEDEEDDNWIEDDSDPEFDLEVADLAEFLWSQSVVEEMAWPKEIEREPIPDDDPIEPDLLDEEVEMAIWSSGSMSAISQFGDSARKGRYSSDKHAGRRLARKAWARHPHRFPLYEVTEADIAVEAAFLDGYREAVERRLAARGVEGITVEVIPSRRAA